MNKRVVFIHSLFRTGSTYLWNKFRESSKYYCYYEPLHQILIKYNEKTPLWDFSERSNNQRHHPLLSKPHHQEYQKLLKPEIGLPYFKKSFPFDEFTKVRSDSDFKKYINLLIQGAGKKIPFLQFNRSALRIHWFKKTYPNALNVYLVRNPWDQWQSYLTMSKENNDDIFHIMDFLIAGIHNKNKYFKPLTAHVPFFEYHNPDLDHELTIYETLINGYSLKEKYFTFYYIWLLSLIESVCYSDFFLNINFFSNKIDYQKIFIAFLKEQGFPEVDFSDAKILENEEYSLSVQEFKTIEHQVQTMIFARLGKKKQSLFWEKFSQQDQDYFHLSRNKLKRENNFSSDKVALKTCKNEKYHELLSVFSLKLIEHKNNLKQKDLKLKQKDKQLNERHNQLQASNTNREVRLKLIKSYETQIQQLKENLQAALKETDELNAQILKKEKQFQEQQAIKKQVVLEKETSLRSRRKEIESINNKLKLKEIELDQQNVMMTQSQQRLSAELTQKNKTIRKLTKDIHINKNRIKSFQYELEVKDKAINGLLNSPTFRIGKVITTPGRVVKKKFKRFQTNEKKNINEKLFLPGCINLRDQITRFYGNHRSGWTYAISSLLPIHDDAGIYLDTFIERTFSWSPDGVKPTRKPWIGIIHVPPNVPNWFQYELSNDAIFASPAWNESLPYCKGLFTLSKYHKNFLEKKLKIPIDSLIHPTEIPEEGWSWDRFKKNSDKKIIQVGWWLRRLHAIYELPKSDYKKFFLKPTEQKYLQDLIAKERHLLKREGAFKTDTYDSVETVSYLSDDVYDQWLSENIVFLCLYDSSANNTVIECIARNTPLLVNPIEPVVEYLGKDYPFYYNNFEEAIEKASNHELVKKTHNYLKICAIKSKLDGKYFRKSIIKSKILNNLNTKD